MTNIKPYLFFNIFLYLFSVSTVLAQNPKGELKRWHKVTLDFEGPNTSESGTPNPFSDYLLTVTFLHNNSGEAYTVQGFFAACGDAENTGCNSGNVWRVHFAPGQTGSWSWTASFNTGSDAAINGGGQPAGFMHGNSGSFTIIESDKTGLDLRSKEKGRLQYVGEHYLRFSGTDPKDPNGKWFVKAGADSPENTLAYEDFDDTPNRKGRRKSWAPHQRDYIAEDASDYTWGNGLGTELLGVLNYLSVQGANAMSFLTFSLGGDDENVFPHLLKVDEDTYNGYGDADQWNKGVYKDRFDVSKMAQWENVFEYADKKGLYLHFKTLETENDQLMDGGNSLGRERKLYYRELVARFGHHLALNWNLSEETSLASSLIIDNTDYLNEIDPYHHNVVLHTYPGDKEKKYNPLLGNKSKLTGASLQSNINQVHRDVITWVRNSLNANRKWVVANDEQGSADRGVRVADKQVREDVLYGTFMAGGAGVEYYYGYTENDGDLNNQDHRLRGNIYKEAGYALNFFEKYFNEYLIGAMSDDDLTTVSGDFVLSNTGKAYAIYLPNGGTTGLSLPTGNSNYTVQWFNPREEGALTLPTTLGPNLTAPDNNDWVALIKKSGTVVQEPITIPGFFEAEDYINQSGTVTEITTDTGGGSNLGSIHNGDYTEYLVDVVAAGTYNISYRVASNTNGGTILLQSNGSVLGKTDVMNTGGWQSWVTVSTEVEFAVGEQTIRLAFEGGDGYLFNVNHVEVTLKTDDGGDNGTNDSCVVLEKNGVVAVEAEDFINQKSTDIRKWYIQDGNHSTPTPDPDASHHSSASGGAYLEILPDTRVTHDDQLINGENFTNTGGSIAVLDYKINFTNPGKYFVFVRAYSTGTEDNGIHVGINGTWPASGNKMQWCAGKNKWTWESKQRTAANHCGEEQKIFLNIPSAGEHIISFSMREDGFEFDKFVLTQEFNKPVGTGPDVVRTDCGQVAENKAPEISLNSPSSGLSFNVGDNIQFSAEATDMDGTIEKVEFYANGELILTINDAPYQESYVFTDAGSYQITAVATDNEGKSSSTESIIITINAVDNENKAPEISLISPSSGLSFNVGDNIQFSAEATDMDGTIEKVEFYANGELILTTNDAPYQESYVFTDAGTYQITAVATDNQGKTATTESIIITINAVDNENKAPEITLKSPSNGSSFNVVDTIQFSAEATDMDGTIEKVEFYADGELILTTNDAPYQDNYVFTDAGTYQITAVATDNQGKTATTESIIITINAVDNENKAPEITLISPSNGSSFNVGDTIQFSAEATDLDGTIEKVEFYANGELILTTNDAPYQESYVFTDAGTYQITAVATDNEGKSSSTESIIITINAVDNENKAPEISLISPSNSSSYNVGDTVQFSAEATDLDGTIEKVEFYANGELILTTDDAPYQESYVFTDAGTYQITAVATDNEGKSSSTEPIKIIINATEDNSEPAADVILYPNPAEDIISVEGISLQKAIIYDILGRIMNNNGITIMQEDKRIDISKIPPGFYFLVIEDSESSKVTFKFLKI